MTSPAPYAAVVFAGHNTAGGWCQCGCVACICDPNEEATPCLNSVGAVSDRNVNQGDGSADPGSDFDLVNSGFILLLILFALSRFRASIL
jgi:hypothetical protein